jgi:hypothetical protein
VLAHAAEVAGYDVVEVYRSGTTTDGYVAFENSSAKSHLRTLGANGAQMSFDVPIDPILGANPFRWRLTLSTASGRRIADTIPAPSGTVAFPPR